MVGYEKWLEMYKSMLMNAAMTKSISDGEYSRCKEAIFTYGPEIYNGMFNAFIREGNSPSSAETYCSCYYPCASYDGIMSLYNFIASNPTASSMEIKAVIKQVEETKKAEKRSERKTKLILFAVVIVLALIFIKLVF